MWRFTNYQFLECLHQSEHTLVARTRRLTDQQTVVLKTTSDEQQSAFRAARYRREFDIGRGFHEDTIIGYFDMIFEGGRVALITEDFGGIGLHRLLEKATPRPEVALHVAIQMAEALNAVHRRGLIHKDVKPANIVINAKDNRAKLIDFGISCQLQRESQCDLNPQRIEGSLSYMSPEQTGRMNRKLDYRSDFYSLGVTLYRMTTGRLPFPQEEPLELIHAHIARRPEPPPQINAAIPNMLSEIILKLMAKNVEDRYQSALGLKSDLARCLRDLQQGGETLFALGRYDVSDRFHIPQKLYGRDRELQELLEIYERVGIGSCEFLLVSGYAGVGKSQLVQEIRKPVTQRRGHYVAGKFDQLNRNQAYSAIIMALRGLIAQILCEPDETIERWSQRLCKALGDNAGLMVALIPDFETLLHTKATTTADHVALDNERRRFQHAFRTLISACTDEQHPLVLFLDDLQWADQASLQLIETLLGDGGIPHLLLIAAMRDHEVGDDHLTTLTLDRLRCDGVIVRHLNLGPLIKDDLAQLVSDTLSRPLAEAEDLSAALLAKTNGNPFFTIALLKKLYEDGAIFFETEAGQWRWSLNKIEATDAADNVIDFMIDNLGNFSKATVFALEQAACLGAQFPLRVLALARNQSQAQVAKLLWPAVEAELLIPLDDRYRVAHLTQDDQDLDIRYLFQHDRIQQAALAMLAIDQRQSFHLTTGRALLADYRSRKAHTSATDVAEHLNKASKLITDPAERLAAAELNLAAGLKAKKAIAYSAALEFFEQGLIFSPSKGDHRMLLYRLLFHQAEMLFFLGQGERAERSIREAFAFADNPVLLGKIWELRLSWRLAENRWSEALEVGEGALIKLGDKPIGPLKNPLTKLKLLWSEHLLCNRFDMETQLQASDIEDPVVRIKIAVLTRMTLAAYFTSDRLRYYACALRRVDIAQTHGAGPESAHAYGAYGMALIARNRISEGAAFARLSLKMAERYPTSALTSCTRFITAMGALSWVEPYQRIDERLNRAIEIGLQTGEQFYTGMSCTALGHYRVDTDLKRISEDSRGARDILSRLRVESFQRMARCFEQYRRCLRGLTEDPLNFQAADFDEDELTTYFQRERFHTALASYHILKLQLACFFHHPAAAKAQLIAIDKSLQDSTRSLPFFADFIFFGAITEADDDHAEARTLKPYLKHLRCWNHHGAVNTEHRLRLIEAEQARLEGKREAAAIAYETAAHLARTRGHLGEYGFIHHRAAKFHSGRPTLAAIHLNQARGAYLDWKAHGLVALINAEIIQFQEHTGSLHSWDFIPAPIETRSIADGDPETSSRNGLDMETIIKAAMAISREIDDKRLVVQMLHIIAENAGAQRGVLIVRGAQGYEVRAVLDEAVMQTPCILLTQYDDLAKSLIRYSLRTNETIVLENAVQNQTYGQDAYIRRARPKSILCAPIRYGDQTLGILYLENNLLNDAFQEDRVSFLTLLIAQAAISLENARLFANTKDAEAQVRQLNQELGQLNEDLEARVVERTAELSRTQRELVEQAHKAGMADIATSVLHNVGNILNSVITSVQFLERGAEQTRLRGLLKANELLSKHREDLATFFQSPQGGNLADYYLELGTEFKRDQERAIEISKRITEKTTAIRNVIMEQHIFASSGFQMDRLQLADIVEEALIILTGLFPTDEVQIDKDYVATASVSLQKHKMIHVLITVLRHAREALGQTKERRLHIHIFQDQDNAILAIGHNGEGLTPDQQRDLFSQVEGDHRGLGLHTCANAITEMGGRLSVNSDGPDAGATFILSFPVQTATDSDV